MTNQIVEKVCTVCKELKPLEEFGKTRRKLDGREAQCRVCVSAYRKQRHLKKQKTGFSRDGHLWAKYKMRPEEYDNLAQAQNGVCAICNKPPKSKERYLVVDHCHVTGIVRGLLCVSCNIGIGNFGDSIEGLEKALRYLRNIEQGNIPPQPSKELKPVMQGKHHHWYGGTSLSPRGEDSPNAILTDAKVRKILADWATGSVTQKALGQEHGVSTVTIQKVIQRKLWKHVIV